MPFVKGQTGNPNGRPSRGTAMADQLRRVLKTKDADGKTAQEAIAEQLVKLAREGNVVAIREIYDRIDGRSMQVQEITGAGGGPVTIRVVYDGEEGAS